MKKKVIAIEKLKDGSIFKYEDGSEEMIYGVYGTLSNNKKEDEDMIEDEDFMEDDETEDAIEALRKLK